MSSNSENNNTDISDEASAEPAAEQDQIEQEQAMPSQTDQGNAAEPDAVVRSEAERETEIEIETETETETESSAEDEVDVEAEAESEVIAEVEAEAELWADAESEVDSGAEADADPDIELDLDAEAQVQAESETDAAATELVEDDTAAAPETEAERVELDADVAPDAAVALLAAELAAESVAEEPAADGPHLTIVPVEELAAEQVRSVIEAALFAADEALTIDRLFKLFVVGELAEEGGRIQIRDALTELEAACDDRGFELKKVASGYRMQVRQNLSPWVSRLWEEKPPRYTRALLETMALIAYKQPATRGDIEEVRGVAVSSNIMRTLLERGWIREVGQRDVPGRPSMYGTTKDFLDYFNLSSLDQLPSLPEIRELVEPAQIPEEPLVALVDSAAADLDSAAADLDSAAADLDSAAADLDKESAADLDEESAADLDKTVDEDTVAEDANDQADGQTDDEVDELAADDAPTEVDVAEEWEAVEADLDDSTEEALAVAVDQETADQETADQEITDQDDAEQSETESLDVVAREDEESVVGSDDVQGVDMPDSNDGYNTSSAPVFADNEVLVVSESASVEVQQTPELTKLPAADSQE